MRKFALFVFAIAAVVFFGSQEARAQDAPKYDVFAGYSYKSDDIIRERLNLNGFEASVTRHFSNGLGIEGNIAGNYGDHTHHTYMAGLKYTFKGDTVRPYVHALAGLDQFQTSDVGFATAFGGGVDARLNDRVSIRIVQVDYAPVFYPEAAHNVRVSTGIVFTF